jgi:hypothetical protein
MMKFMSVLGRYDASELCQMESAELLGMSEGTFRRWSVPTFSPIAKPQRCAWCSRPSSRL